MYLQAKMKSLTKRQLAKDRTLSPYWKNDLPPTTKRFKGSLIKAGHCNDYFYAQF